VIQHHDHGRQYTSVAYRQRLAADEIPGAKMNLPVIEQHQQGIGVGL
jgi:hypothetical protein